MQFLKVPSLGIEVSFKMPVDSFTLNRLGEIRQIENCKETFVSRKHLKKTCAAPAGTVLSFPGKVLSETETDVHTLSKGKGV